MAQEGAAKHKEALRDTLQLYEAKAKALLLIPSGTTAAKVPIYYFNDERFVVQVVVVR